MSSGITRQYDPSQVVCNWGGADISGYAQGSFAEVDRSKDAASVNVGSDGEATLVISQDKSGTIKVTLQQSSPMNDIFAAAAVALQNRDLANAVKPFLMKDLNGSSIAKAKQSWVKKLAKGSYETEATNREWIIETGYLDWVPGGELGI